MSDDREKGKEYIALLTAIVGLITAFAPLVVGLIKNQNKPSEGFAKTYQEGFAIITNNVFKPTASVASQQVATPDKQDPQIQSAPQVVQKMPPETAIDSAATSTIDGKSQAPSSPSCLGLPNALNLKNIYADWAKPSVYIVRIIVQNTSSQAISFLSGGEEQLTDTDKNQLGFASTSLIRHGFDSREGNAKGFYEAGEILEPNSTGAVSFTFTGATRASRDVTISANLFYITLESTDRFIPKIRNFNCENVPVR